MRVLQAQEATTGLFHLSSFVLPAPFFELLHLRLQPKQDISTPSAYTVEALLVPAHNAVDPICTASSFRAGWSEQYYQCCNFDFKYARLQSRSTQFTVIDQVARKLYHRRRSYRLVGLVQSITGAELLREQWSIRCTVLVQPEPLVNLLGSRCPRVFLDYEILLVGSFRIQTNNPSNHRVYGFCRALRPPNIVSSHVHSIHCC